MMNRKIPTLLLSCQVLLSSFAFAAQSDSATDSHQSAISASIDYAEQIAAYELQIAELESTYGPLDIRILEPVAALSALLKKVDDIDAYEVQLNRQQGLLRVNEGLGSLRQIPLFVEKIRIDFQRGEWETVAEHFESIYSVHVQNPSVSTEALLSSLNDIRAWHLLAMSLDTAELRAMHIAQANSVQQRLLSVISERTDEDSRVFIPWLYSMASDTYRLINYLQAEKLLTSVADDYQGHTVRYVEFIQEILENTGNAESQAMAMIYRADFQLLNREYRGSSIGGRVRVSRRGIADQTYRRAIEKLREAGVEQELIDAFFARPVPLPVSNFHFTLEEALQHRAADGFQNESATGHSESEEGFHIGDFSWTTNLPMAQISAVPDLLDLISTEQSSALVSFTVDTLGRAKSSEVIEASPDDVMVRSSAIDSVEVIHFRPAFIDRRWRRVRNVSMRMVFAPQIPDAESAGN